MAEKQDESEHEFMLADTMLRARASGALWWPDHQLLAVSDLHLGKSERVARQGGTLLPPYETRDTLDRLEAELSAKQPETIVCLGDSFDDLAAAEGLDQKTSDRLVRLMGECEWIWIAGNHDPEPALPDCRYMTELTIAPLTFRHIAVAGSCGEVSGHYHPKTTIHTGGQSVTCSCFLHDRDRVILPAFGTYTGGLKHTAPELSKLMGTGTCAILTGTKARTVPLRDL